MTERFTRLTLLIGMACLLSCSKTDIGNGGKADNQKEVGTSAHEILTASKYSSAVIELQYMPGYPPDPTAVSNLAAFLDMLTNKPEGITVKVTPIPSGNKVAYSLEDINGYERAYRTTYNIKNKIALYCIYLDGYYVDNRVLGFSYLNTSLCVFGRKLYENSGAPNKPERIKLESIILEHEMGHLLGLVNMGSPLQSLHEDTLSARHCKNPNCLMYFSVQTSNVPGPLNNGPIPVLDANCRADLKANGGR